MSEISQETINMLLRRIQDLESRVGILEDNPRVRDPHITPRIDELPDSLRNPYPWIQPGQPIWVDPNYVPTTSDRITYTNRTHIGDPLPDQETSITYNGVNQNDENY